MMNLKSWNTVPHLRQRIVLLTGAALVALWCVVIARGSFPGPAGGDFYQLWLGARALIEDGAPYGEAVRGEMRRAYAEWGQHGLPYPLPAVVAMVPFALLPLSVALVIWMALSLLAVFGSALLGRAWYVQLALPVLFVPLFRTAGLRQPTLMWVGLAVLLVLALQRRWSIVAGLCLALLPLKPQTGLVFALAGGLWALRYHRPAVAWGIGWTLLLWGASFVLVPDWVETVLHSMSRYRELYVTRWLMPLGVLAVLAAYRLPWWGIAAVAQVVLFPLHDVYGTLPLLLGWAAIGGPVALVGAGLSWLWAFTGDVEFATRLWLVLLVPFSVAALWRAYTLRQERAAVPRPEPAPEMELRAS